MSTLSGHSAPGQALGYYWQVHLALLQLAKGSSDGMVGIETLDDVAFSGPDGRTILIQSKSTTDPVRNPLSDTSPALWKTLATWTAALRAGDFKPAVTTLILATNATLTDCLALRIGVATEAEIVNAVVAELRRTPTKPAESIRELVNAVRSASDSELSRLVQCVHVEHGGTGHGRDDVREQILAKSHLPDGVRPDSFLDAMVGWLHNVAVSAWSAGTPAWIGQSAFANMRQHVVESQRRRRVRELPSRAIICDPAHVESHRSSGFVRQLEIIDADGATIDDAITDFIKHNHERLRLVKEGHVLDEDWHQFEDRLVEHWKPIARGQPAARTKQEMRRIGTTVYNEAQRHRESLAGQPTEEPYLTRGAYQRLADSLTVGWHPKFKTLVAKVAT
ncbi:MAG: hypothetical protein AMXMBFR58_00170 [Phycisphaerae bacterium]